MSVGGAEGQGLGAVLERSSNSVDLRAGSTFFLEGEDVHLWMIISDPDLDPDRVVLVNFASWQHHHDQTCVVEVGEHRFLRSRGVVYYPGPKMMTMRQLRLRQSQKLLTMRGELSESLLQRIRAGALASPRMPMEPGEIILEQFPELAES